MTTTSHSFLRAQFGPAHELVDRLLCYDCVTHRNGLHPMQLAEIEDAHPEIQLLLVAVAEQLIRDGAGPDEQAEIREALVRAVCYLLWFCDEPVRVATELYGGGFDGVGTAMLAEAVSRWPQRILDLCGISLPSPGALLRTICPLELAPDSMAAVKVSLVPELWPEEGAGCAALKTYRLLNRSELLMYAQRHYLARKLAGGRPGWCWSELCDLLRYEVLKAPVVPPGDDEAEYRGPHGLGGQLLRCERIVRVIPGYEAMRGNDSLCDSLRRWLNCIGNLRIRVGADAGSDPDMRIADRFGTRDEIQDSFLTREEYEAYARLEAAVDPCEFCVRFVFATAFRFVRMYRELENI